jgi:hypothetical protein
VSTRPERLDLVLSGPLLEGVENHSLSVLLAAAQEQGEATAVVPFSGFRDVESAVDTVLRMAPRVFGVSIQSTESALASLVLTRALRLRGFRGHVVCGGHFATLNAPDILASPGGVDSVVRFAGQEALCGILRLTRDIDSPREAWLALPGIVLRSPDGEILHGAPGRPVGSTGLRAAPRTERLPRHLGIPAADLVTSHGCEAHCAYCCVAAMTRIERAESGERQAYGRRATGGIADEVAEMWHRQGARVFNFMDDNLLPMDPGEAHGWIGELERDLHRRGVGRIAFSLQFRADVLSSEVADALVQLGLVRAYVGIDATSRSMLRTLGRSAADGVGERALARLAERGVFAVCNALLIGPTVRFVDLRAETASLARLEGAPMHLLPIDVRAGTTYFERAASRGLLEGNFLYRTYRFEDKRTERVARVLLALPTRLEERSVPVALYDVGYNLGIARRLIPDVRLLVGEIEETYRKIANAWNADQIRLILAAMDAADSGDSAVEELIAREAPLVERHDRALLDACDEALARLEREVTLARGRPARAHARGRLLAAALSMSVAACGDRTGLFVPTADSSVGTGGTGAGSSGGFGGGDDALVDDASIGFGGPDAFVQDEPVEYDAAVPTDAGCASYGDAAIPDAEPPPGNLCSDGTQAQGPPFDFARSCMNCFTPAFLEFDSNGFLVSVQSESSWVVNCLQAFLGKACYPSLACTVQTLRGHCWVA